MEQLFFELNSEKRIGYKILSEAEKGLTKGNITHIGLSSKVLTFLADKGVVKSAMFIYEDYSDILSCHFDRINRSNGKFECPKIKQGGDKENSLREKIMDIVKTDPMLEWLLIWVGLASEELVFWLINSKSPDFIPARQIFKKGNVASALTETSPLFEKACSFLTKKINITTTNLQKELEILSQIGEAKRPFKTFDVEKANRRFIEIGREGEELINQFLEKEKAKGKLKTFTWKNKSKESGEPFDFIINSRLYVDVKSTVYDFDQELYFSNQEIDYIAQKKESAYAVFRVYDMEKEERKLRICKKCAKYMAGMNSSIQIFSNYAISQHAILKTIKLGIKPNICFQSIEKPVII